MSEVYHDSPEEKERRRLLRKASEDRRREQIRAADRARSTTDEYRAKRRERERPKREARRAQKELEKRNTPLPPPVLFRLCPRCDPPVEKPIKAFSLDKTRPNGHYPICRECVAIENHSKLEQRRKYDQERRLNNVEHRQAEKDYLNKWRRENPLQQRELTLKRNALKQKARVGRVSFKRILRRDGSFCYLCQRPIIDGEKLDFDHVVPLSRGGSHTEDNIKVAHAACNRSKGNKLLEEWRNR